MLMMDLDPDPMDYHWKQVVLGMKSKPKMEEGVACRDSCTWQIDEPGGARPPDVAPKL